MKISAKSLVHFARTAKNYMRSALSYILHRFRIRGLVVTEYQSGFPGNVALVLAHRYPANFRRSPSTFRCRRIARRIFQVSPPHSTEEKSRRACLNGARSEMNTLYGLCCRKVPRRISRMLSIIHNAAGNLESAGSCGDLSYSRRKFSRPPSEIVKTFRP